MQMHVNSSSHVLHKLPLRNTNGHTIRSSKYRKFPQLNGKYMALGNTTRIISFN